MGNFDKKFQDKIDYREIIKAKAIAAGTSPRLALERIGKGWSEDEAVNKELRTKRLQKEARKSRAEKASKGLSFLGATRPLVIPKGPMPETAGQKLMAKALEASRKLIDKKVDGENKYTKTIRELIEGKL